MIRSHPLAPSSRSRKASGESPTMPRAITSPPASAPAAGGDPAARRAPLRLAAAAPPPGPHGHQLVASRQDRDPRTASNPDGGASYGSAGSDVHRTQPAPRGEHHLSRFEVFTCMAHMLSWSWRGENENAALRILTGVLDRHDSVGAEGYRRPGGDGDHCAASERPDDRPSPGVTGHGEPRRGCGRRGGAVICADRKAVHLRVVTAGERPPGDHRT